MQVASYNPLGPRSHLEIKGQMSFGKRILNEFAAYVIDHIKTMYGVHVTTSLIQGHGHTEEVKSHTAMEETFAFVRKYIYFVNSALLGNTITEEIVAVVLGQQTNIVNHVVNAFLQLFVCHTISGYMVITKF